MLSDIFQIFLKILIYSQIYAFREGTEGLCIQAVINFEGDIICMTMVWLFKILLCIDLQLLTKINEPLRFIK